MRSFIAFFIRYPAASNLIFLAVFLGGYFALQTIKSTPFPEFDPRLITVQIVYPGAAPDEIEEGVVLKIEDNLKGIRGIERITSTSSENSGTINIEIQKGMDNDIVLQDVKNAIDRISSFPADMEPLVIFRAEPRNFAFSFALSGDVDLRMLKQYARGVENDLRNAEGISQVEINGYPAEEIEISIREADLRAYNLRFDDVANAVRAHNFDLTGGTIKGATEELLIRSRGKEYYAADIENIVVKTQPDGKVVLLREVASVRDRWADSPNKSFFNGKRSVVITVNKNKDEDLRQITDYVKDYIRNFNERNDIVKADVVRDGSIILNQRIELLVSNGIVGALLVIIFLAMFMNVRLSLWVAAGIPFAFMGMFIIGAFTDMTINAISLFGMILVVGILVDDGIVISENIYQKFEQGMSPFEAALEGTMEVLPSVIAAVLTTVVAFSAFFFLDGRTGDFIRDMAFVVIVTLLISLVESALILPGHLAHSKALHKQASLPWLRRVLDKITGFQRDKIYTPILRFVLENKFLSVSIPIALFFITLGAVQGELIKTTFFPFIDRDNVTITLKLPAGTRDSITEQWLMYIEQQAKAVNEQFSKQRSDSLQIIENIERKTGPLSNEGTVELTLLDGEARNLPSFTVTAALRDRVGAIPDAEEISYGVQTFFGKPVSISLLSYDLKALSAAVNELKDALSAYPMVKDIVDSDREGLREIDVQLKPKAYLLGLTRQEVIQQIRQGFFGLEAQRLQRGQDEVRVWVRYTEEDRSSAGNLEAMRIRLRDGREFPLAEIADFTTKRGIVAINHLDGRREIKIEADLADQNEPVPPILADIRERILPPILAKYPTVGFSFEGQQRQTDKTAASAKIVVPIIFFLMVSIMILTFRSFKQALIIVALLPFGLIGVAWGHYIHGLPLSILSLYGVIALLGIMVNDALVYIETMNLNLEQGQSLGDAVYNAGVSRFRPIVLTSVTTIVGLGPLVLERSLQAQFLIPMAISVAYGLLFATVINLLILPAFLIGTNSLHRLSYRLWHGRKPTPEEVEPAVIHLQSKNVH